MCRLLLAVALLLVVGATATGWFAVSWYRAPGPLSTPTTLVLAKPGGTEAIIQQLVDAGITDRPMLLRLAARLTRSDGELKFGEYAFPAGVSPEQLLALLRSGKTVVHHLIVPEGLTVAEIASLVQHADALAGEIGTLPAEGSLFPATYYYSWGDKRQALIDLMRRKMDKTLDELWPTRTANVALADRLQAVTLASIIEKETAIADERPKIAGVFFNRLRLGMRLQSDPTVSYAVTQGQAPLGRALTKADLDLASPYNTYRQAGLPPGPICNPGRAALIAALRPDDTDALYFVADGSGGHAFAATLDAHRQNVARWRALEAGKN
jgi:UPF0755 protein